MSDLNSTALQHRLAPHPRLLLSTSCWPTWYAGHPLLCCPALVGGVIKYLQLRPACAQPSLLGCADACLADQAVDVLALVQAALPAGTGRCMCVSLSLAPTVTGHLRRACHQRRCSRPSRPQAVADPSGDGPCPQCSYLWICTRLGVSPGLVLKGTWTLGRRCGWLSSVQASNSSATGVADAGLLTLAPMPGSAPPAWRWSGCCLPCMHGVVCLREDSDSGVLLPRMHSCVPAPDAPTALAHRCKAACSGRKVPSLLWGC